MCGWKDMNKKLSEVQKRKALVSLIRKTWESLDSHLDWAVEKNPREKDPRSFHADCVIDYAEQIANKARLLK